jgi:hypothetical protein
MVGEMRAGYRHAGPSGAASGSKPAADRSQPHVSILPLGDRRPAHGSGQQADQEQHEKHYE